MTELFRKKFLIPTTRLTGYDYSQPGYYFITICAKGRFCYFGEIVGNKMVLNDVGKIVQNELLKTPKMRKNVQLDEWIIMPNHIHAIIHIDDTAVETRNDVETHCNASLRANHADDSESYKNKFGPQHNNLSSIVRGFKGATTKIINEQFGRDYFAWQPRFYDHIVRTEKSYTGIQWYIQTNPERWDRDRNNLEGVFM